MRRTTPAIILALALLLNLAMPNTVQADAADDLMQCVSDCVLENGKSELATCKQGCAGINPLTQQNGNQGCMATFKQCKKDCGSDKSCKKECKTNLLNCV